MRLSGEKGCRMKVLHGSQEWLVVVQRLERLEKHNQILKWLASATGIAIVAVGLLRGQTATEKTLEADDFILRDQRGVVRASLAMVAGAPMLRVFDSTGKPRLALGMTAAGVASLAVLDGNGK